MTNTEMKPHARLVYDGGDVHVPPEMGEPRADQLQGTPLERLCELAGRVSYDSLGKGRSSADYHRHIAEVGHLSTIEHANFTVRVPWTEEHVPYCLLNRPGLWVERSMVSLRLTVNLRTAAEWFKKTPEGQVDRWAALVGTLLQLRAESLAPNIVRLDPEWSGERSDLAKNDDPVLRAATAEPATDAEKWVTLWLRGSRGFSHELVRHGDWTAISQRSTRYVDESESWWVEHPLITAFRVDQPSPSDVPSGPHSMCNADIAIGEAQFVYKNAVDLLNAWLLTRGVDKATARKQARGAARGYLGNALETELIFSASVAQWRHMLRMRAADAADAEIRAVFCEALPILQACRYGDSFADMKLVPAKDGIGMSLEGGGAK